MSEELKSDREACCCGQRIPSGSSGNGSPVSAPIDIQAQNLHDDVLLSGGTFEMGDAFGEGRESDGERPVHTVSISPFQIDRTCVTNDQFEGFIAATGYVTDAERIGDSAVFAAFVAAESGDLVGHHDTRWWLTVRGADWRHPFGRHSSIEDSGKHPVVHVSYDDAQAYCRWAGRTLPSEAEWEYAARAGHKGLRFPWGDDLEPDGVHMANVWQGEFPGRNTGADGWLATAPVASYPPSDFGLYDMIGNVWEWCADWYDRDYYTQSPSLDPLGPATGDRRVARGGSYLCHRSYCKRYRVAARLSNTPESTACNLGFRTVLRSDRG
ncbi:sulfatase modifying factor 1 (C-alpha-formyglycine- generating enzyme 1) [Rhizobium sp. R339]|uniref:formylglycine-generating enzyme family protein n=1 Tax=Rhizobium sp. R339 TaxID=1764273 RepID=UPI000B52C8AA|nr:formylglycine-generating enzyme family protein [Rhizobium sp. R339]OWV72976.1 sulfatase modifying factor 1 (C-alpha-formyglycine- generating enzyme 1) [Rhizobium sp. R339]